MYERRDINNAAVVPQPASNTITLFGGNEGWSTITHEDWNGNYSKRDISNNVVSAGTYSKRDVSNNVIVASEYQRRDTSNTPVIA